MKNLKELRGQKRAGDSKRRGVTGKFYIGLIAVFLAVVLTMQLGNLHKKNAAYAREEAALMKELEEQQERSQELDDYEAYTKSDEYTENTAKSKLGLIHKNEIIFREK